MSRSERVAPGGMVFHVLNRGVGRMKLFLKNGDFEAFERMLEKTLESRPMRVLGYCLMPNHWHLVLSPKAPLALSSFMHRLTTAHARAWQYSNGTPGQGAVYQGRFAAIPIQSDRHFLIVCRYVERNALRAALVDRAQDWPWSSLCRRAQEGVVPWLAPWPVERAPTWTDNVNKPQTPAEVESVRRATRRGLPFGDDEWAHKVAGPERRRRLHQRRD